MELRRCPGRATTGWRTLTRWCIPSDASNRSDRVGMRLQGRPLHRWPDRQPPGEGVTRGAIQVLPNDVPVIPAGSPDEVNRSSASPTRTQVSRVIRPGHA